MTRLLIYPQPVKRVAQPSMANGQTRPVTRKGPYPATTAVSNGPTTKPVNGKPAVKTAESASPQPATSPTEETAANGKSIPSHPAEVVSPTLTAASETIDESGSPPPSSTEELLKYQDGAVVDSKNLAETQTFRQFLTEKKQPPASKTVLQAYYRQQPVVG